MDKQLKLALVKIVKFWQGLGKVARGIIVGGMSIAMILAIAVPILLRSGNGSDAILYRNLSSEESSKIYGVLQEMSVDVSMNSKGEIIVPAKDVNYLKLQLSTLGYPKTALSYDTFSSNAGFMSTELEKKQYLLIDLQNRLQETIRWIEGVNDAVVTLNIPQDTNYIWNANNQKSTGSVMLAVSPSSDITNKQVMAIKNLVASSVPKMTAADVTVLNASTGTEFITDSSDGTSGMSGNLLQLQFERDVEKRMEDKVLNLLTLPFGINNVRVSATVTLDYDKMLQEEVQYIPELDGNGVISKLEEWYSTNNDGVSGGIVGEEDNTDVPTYPQIGGSGNEKDEFSNKAEYLVSYIKTQIERNNAIMKSNSISVVIHNAVLTDDDKVSLTDTIAKATNIPIDNIMVNSFFIETLNEEPVVNPITGSEGIPLPYVIGAAIAILLAILVIITLLLNNRKKAKELEAMAAQSAAAESNALEHLMVLQRDKEKDKERQIDQFHSAKAREALENIQNFSYQNPEITATLIRDLLREDD